MSNDWTKEENDTFEVITKELKREREVQDDYLAFLYRVLYEVRKGSNWGDGANVSDPSSDRQAIPKRFPNPILLESSVKDVLTPGNGGAARLAWEDLMCEFRAHWRQSPGSLTFYLEQCFGAIRERVNKH